MSIEYCHKHHNNYDTDFETECPHCVDEEINKEEKIMEISKPEYRKNIISNCCGAYVYENTDECKDCLEHCSFILEKPTAFHQWLLVTSEHEKTNLIALLRNEIVANQNQQVFELMDTVDMGEQNYNSETLERVANLLLDTKFQHATCLDDETFIIEQDKKIEKLKLTNKTKTNGNK